MENLNAEQIIKALERDIRISIDLNYECPRITYSKLRDALALITAQEQRIKELNEESKKWEQAYDCMDSACRELSDKCDRLTEENERLRAEVSVKRKLLDEAENRYNETAKRFYKEGVKDMAEKSKEHSRKMQSSDFSGEFWCKAVMVETIDQIAKEMLEDKTNV